MFNAIINVVGHEVVGRNVFKRLSADGFFRQDLTSLGVAFFKRSTKNATVWKLERFINSNNEVL